MDDHRFWCCPRYRVEHRHPDLATLIVGFDDTAHGIQARLALAHLRCRKRRLAGELVVVAQESDRDLLRVPV